MRIAVLADIHANLEALRAVLERLSGLGADAIVCLGDIVGYNANPSECVEIVRSEGMVCVLGNHDAAAAGLIEPDNFNPLARAAALWTRGRLTEENRTFLSGLPEEREFRGSYLFHGSIHDRDRYILHRDDAAENFRRLSELPGGVARGFFGHTHVRAVLMEKGGIISASLARDSLDLDAGRRYLINPGSVGQPRDGDPQASFLVYDDQARQAVFYRVAYDIAACQEKIIRAGLPPRLAERLEAGW